MRCRTASRNAHHRSDHAVAAMTMWSTMRGIGLGGDEVAAFSRATGMGARASMSASRCSTPTISGATTIENRHTARMSWY